MSLLVGENNSLSVFSKEPLQLSKPSEFYSSITLLVIGIILVLGGLAITGIYISNAFPHFFDTLAPTPLITTLLATGFVIISVGSYLYMNCKEKCVRVASDAFLQQAEANIRLALKAYSMDPRRFNVLGTTECPIIQTVSMPRYLLQYLFNSRKEASSMLRNALNRSATIINSKDLNQNLLPNIIFLPQRPIY